MANNSARTASSRVCDRGCNWWEDDLKLPAASAKATSESRWQTWLRSRTSRRNRPRFRPSAPAFRDHGHIGQWSIRWRRRDRGRIIGGRRRVDCREATTASGCWSWSRVVLPYAGRWRDHGSLLSGMRATDMRRSRHPPRQAAAGQAVRKAAVNSLFRCSMPAFDSLTHCPRGTPHCLGHCSPTFGIPKRGDAMAVSPWDQFDSRVVSPAGSNWEDSPDRSGHAWVPGVVRCSRVAELPSVRMTAWMPIHHDRARPGPSPVSATCQWSGLTE